MKSPFTIFLYALTLLLLVACGGDQRRDDAVLVVEPDSVAMQRLNGIWVDAETQTVVFRVDGDSLFYPNSSSQPVRFTIYEDTLLLYTADSVRFPIIRQKDYSFVYESLSGDSITLLRSENPLDSLIFFSTGHEYAPILLNEEVSRDTVVFSPSNERYHLYIKVNPTHYRVVQTTFTDEGLPIENVYFDNIIHVGVYNGRDKLFSHDFVKADFAELIPQEFLKGAILSNGEFGNVDRDGCHFNITLCQPNGSSCYVVSVVVDYRGQLEKKLIEY